MQVRPKALKKQIQMIFQNALGSFNPRQTIQDSLKQPLIEHKIVTNDIDQEINDLLLSVGLEAQLKNRFPHQVSGGQIQRAAIARAIACKPSLLIADEPTSALDVSVRAYVLELFKELKKNKNLSLLIITHDLMSLKNLASRVYVMHNGQIVESGQTTDILNNPKQLYTQRLIAAIPSLNPADQTFKNFMARKLGSQAA
jgi:ABC-type oligopeptide transport system ATPase subunit